MCRFPRIFQSELPSAFEAHSKDKESSDPNVYPPEPIIVNTKFALATSPTAPSTPEAIIRMIG